MGIYKKQYSGFTLIELLVVIAIIGLLSSVVFASLNSARGKARDAKRMADLREIQKAIEFYYDDNGRYPTETWCDSSRGGGNADCSSFSGTNWNISSAFYQALVPTYMSSLPVDPINSSSYYYLYEPVNINTDYCIAVNLENGSRFILKNGPTAPSGC